MNMVKKNELVIEFRKAISNYESLYSTASIIANGVTFKRGFVERSISDELMKIDSHIDELVDLFTETGHLSEREDLEWDEESLHDLEISRRVARIEQKLANGKQIKIPEDLIDQFPPKGPQFSEYIEKLIENESDSDIPDYNDEITCIRGAISDWIELNESTFELTELIEFSNDGEAKIAKQVLSNVEDLWAKLILAISTVAYAF